MLEIEYNGEEGTGLGPTLEFYALVCLRFRISSRFHNFILGGRRVATKGAGYLVVRRSR